MFQRSFLWDKVIGSAYLLFQLRLPYRVLTNPEERANVAMMVAVAAIVILIPLIMTIPFLMSRRWGAYLFIIMHLYTLIANRVTNQTPGPGQVVAVLLIVYCVLRLSGKVGPPLHDWKDNLNSN